ncbi:hypothetical protein K6W81_18650 [Enterobacter sp. MW07]|nr:hypothetical protein [Enterobacter sp. MW07]
MSEREIVLEQALIAVIGAYRNEGGDVENLMREAHGLIIDNSPYRIVGHPHVTQACVEIANAVKFKK